MSAGYSTDRHLNFKEEPNVDGAMISGSVFAGALLSGLVAFVFTNIDDLLVLIVFFSQSKAETTHKVPFLPGHVVAGQYLGFSTLVAISLIGFAVGSFVSPEYLGWFGFIPIFIGLYKLYDIGRVEICHVQDDDDDDDEDQLIIVRPEDDDLVRVNITPLSTIESVEYSESDVVAVTIIDQSPPPMSGGFFSVIRGCFSLITSRHVFKVALITIANGSDNIAVYVPLFAVSDGASITIIVIVMLILVMVWCSISYSLLRFKYIAQILSDYGIYIVPFALIGLGIYILISSNAFDVTK